MRVGVGLVFGCYNCDGHWGAEVSDLRVVWDGSLEQAKVKDPSKPPKINIERQKEPRWVMRGTNRTNIEIFFP